jgi:hypothetical protein
MPGPVSRTDRWNDPSVALAAMTTSPASVNLMALPDEIDQHLRQAPPVAMTRSQLRSDLDLEPELLMGSQRLERAADGLGNILDGVNQTVRARAGRPRSWTDRARH